ncbi:MAG: hypothetical protein KVP17_002713 [Porospora cf. gigantea B]|uniref:uncharacterized protein n=1 Tax=Porospora cf. gigantea B TaxID=2853592 RepID=UPI003571CB08|nr:MAG: hypothetical protein KVP17_002713 [Porospora cf. gigantea B]
MADVLPTVTNDATLHEAQEEITDLGVAVEQVIKTALKSDGLRRGIHECVKVIDGGRAHVCFLADSVEEEAYTKLIKALCEEKSVPIIHIPNQKTLGEMCGLCKIDRDGNPRKVVGCGVAVITEYGLDTQAFQFLKKHLSSLQK